MITAIVQARMGSARLPGKTLRMLAGKPVLQHVIENVSACLGVNQIIVATTDKPEDEAILDWCHKYGVQAIGWNRLLPDGKNDVLGRYVVAADIAKNDIFMRVTADCPLWRPDLGEEVAEALTHKYYIASNVHPELDGFDTEVFPYAALLMADRYATDSYDRQHVTPWMYRNLSVIRLDLRKRVGAEKLSVDTEADFKRIEKKLA